jgi:hypothetical protein
MSPPIDERTIIRPIGNLWDLRNGKPSKEMSSWHTTRSPGSPSSMYTEHFDPDQSYTEVFLSHASLYVLGDFKLIDSLKALALFKLHKTLCVFQVDDGNVEDIIALARYAYSEGGGGGGLDEGIGNLGVCGVWCVSRPGQAVEVECGVFV